MHDDLPTVAQPHLTGVKCAAHDIQLSVQDVLKKKSVANFLVKVRKLVKKLRSQPYVNSFRMDSTKKLPLFDGETRWGSAHLMVKRIKDQQEFIRSMLSEELQREFNEKFWIMVDRFVHVTTPLYLLTKRIQEESLICGSMFLYWKECCLELEEIDDPLAGQLHDALVNRQHMWFDNPAFLAALFVDPRLNDFQPPVLTAEQKEVAIVSNSYSDEYIYLSTITVYSMNHKKAITRMIRSTHILIKMFCIKKLLVKVVDTPEPICVYDWLITYTPKFVSKGHRMGSETRLPFLFLFGYLNHYDQLLDLLPQLF